MKIGAYKLVPLTGGTKEWFKQDIRTIKRSWAKTLKACPLIIVISFFVTTLFYYLSTNQLNFFDILAYFICVTPILILGFFLLHVMVTKGYDITSP